MARPDRELLCTLADLGKTGAFGVERDSEPFDIVIVRDGDVVRGFVNSCPHRGTPLETFPHRFLDETGRQLICSTHGARFDVADGKCLSGPCKVEALCPVALVLSGERIFFDPGQFEG